MNDRKLIRKYDLIIIAVIAVVAAVSALLMRQDLGAAAECVISYNGEVVSRINIDTPSRFTVKEAPDMIFEIRDGKVAALHSDCPDKVCVNAGFIGHAGQSIVCIPNRIVVSFETDSDLTDVPDMVAR